LRAFHLDRSRYPASLNELVPEYLRQVPVDPFDGGEPFHYQAQSGKYTLWSIGPDGVDNHGKPIFNHGKEGHARYWTLPDSQGDMVAGTNR
jgi:hypothetical protein